MEAPDWTDTFTIGIPEIDAEHRELFVALKDFCNLFNAARSRDRAEVQPILRVITEHAIEHFDHEERLMREARYSGYLWHRQQHTTAKKRLAVLIQAARGGGPPECERLVSFLGSWLSDHICVHDRMMSAALRNQAVSTAATKQPRSKLLA